MSMKCRIILGVLLTLYCVVAWFTLVGMYGWFGTTPDGFASLPLLLAGVPWSLLAAGLLAVLGSVGADATYDAMTKLGPLVIFVAPLINLWYLMRRCT